MRKSNNNKVELDLSSLNSDEFLELFLKNVIKRKESLIDIRKRIPLSIFTNKKLSILECIVKYLKENCKYKYSQIAKILNRNDRTIWTTYNNSLKKSKHKLVVEESDFDIPIEIFSKIKYSALETIALYLKDKLDLGFTEIGKMIGRNPKTIWTTYSRAKKK